MFQGRKYKVFRMYVFFHSYEIHSHVSERMHASKTPNTTSFQRGQELELRFVGFFCPLAYVCLLGYITKILGLCVSNLKNFEQELF